MRELIWECRSEDSTGDEDGSQNKEEVEEDTVMDDASSSSDEEEESAERPYNELLQLLHANDSEEPTRKKRKLASDSKTDHAPSTAPEEASDQGEDALDAQAPSDSEEEGQEVEDDDDIIGPFEKHFNIAEGADLTKKIESATSNKWVVAKKEVDGLRLACSKPQLGDTGASILPSLKQTATLKVYGDHPLLIEGRC